MAWFFIIFFSVYGLANYYVLRRFLQLLPVASEPLRVLVIILFIFCAAAYIIEHSLSSKSVSFFSDILAWVGSFWFAILLYGFLLFAVFDLFVFINYILKAFFSVHLSLPAFIRTNLFYIVVFIIAGIIIYGYSNAHVLVVKRFDVALAKGKANDKLKLMFLSDLHLSQVNNGAFLGKILNTADTEKPDLILFGGDIIDAHSVKLEAMGSDKILKQFKAPMGVFSILGNHEYITGRNESISFLKNAGIQLLIDTVINLNGKIQIAGRDDVAKRSFDGTPRKTIEQIYNECDPNIPVILLDHQPFKLDRTSELGFDMQLSGHTHHGQMFPLNWVTSMIYELSWGYFKKGNTIFYVTSGVGTWGPPIKLGNDAEIIIFNITY